MQNNAINLREDESDDLSPGHALLYGQYEIERHLIDGGFGMTYLARDSLDRQVVIKECFPSAVCRRINGEVRPRKPGYQDQYQNVIRSFLREALRMAKFDHPNIVKVHQVFQENNTAYIAMDYVDGMDLLTMLDIDPGRLTDKLVESLLRETLNALAYVHEMGMLHRDISPDNLLLDTNNKLTLIDFGAAREEAARQSRTLSSVMSVKDGYSPHEFYYTDGTQEPSSDIYSIGATFYHLISGVAPPDCQKRVAAVSADAPDPYKPLADNNWSFDASFIAAIDKALSISQKDRLQSARAWLDILDNPQAEIAPEPVDICKTMSAPQAPVFARPVTMASPVKAVEAELGPELVAKIALLVEDTNSRVKQGQPGDARGKDHVEPDMNDEPELLVDIFGEPIDDVDKWLKEQDKKTIRNPAPTRQQKEARQQKAAAKRSQKAQIGRRGFGLFRALSTLSRIQNHAAE